MIDLIKLNVCKYFPVFLWGLKYQPTSVVLSLTNRCNCHCIMCNYWKFESQDELITDEVKDILRQAKKAGVKGCILYGGEPLLRNDLIDLVAFAHQEGLKTEIITNGILISAEKAKALAKSGLDEIVISLDLASEKLDQIRRIEGAHQKTISALAELVKLRDQSSVKIFIASILMRPALRDDNLIKVIELAEKLKIPTIIQLLDFSPFYFKNVDESIKKDLWIGQEDYGRLEMLVDKLIKIKKEKPWLIVNSVPSLNYAKRYFKDPKSKDLPCYVVMSGRIWIDSQGKIYLCQGLPVMGDLRKESFRDIVQSKRWQEGIRKAFAKQCPGCSCSYALNIDMHIPFAWKNMIARKLSFYG